MANFRGVMPPYKIVSLTRNKLGIFSGEIERRYVIAANDIKAQPAWLRDAPTPWKIPFKSSSARIGESQCIVSYAYEGTDPDEPDNNGKDPANLVVEFSGQMSEDDIRTHPDFQKLAKKFGYNFNTQQFEVYAGGSPNNKPLGGVIENSANQISPAYGGEAYLNPGGTLTVTFASRFLPSYVMKDIGTVIQSPPGLSKLGNLGISPKRNWLKLCPDIADRGNIFQITMSYMLSGPKGWLKDVYSSSALQ